MTSKKKKMAEVCTTNVPDSELLVIVGEIKDMVCVHINQDTFEVHLQFPASKKRQIVVFAEEIKEIRCSTVSMKQFTLFYGNKFRLKSIGFEAINEEKAVKWIRNFNNVLSEIPNRSYTDMLNTWVLRSFHSISKNQDEIGLEQFKIFADGVNYRTASGQLGSHFYKGRGSRKVKLSLNAFRLILKEWLFNKEVVDSCFNPYEKLVNHGSSTHFELPLEGFKQFLRVEQQELYCEEMFASAIGTYENVEKDTCVNLENSLNYLFSNANCIWVSPRQDDMTRPLSHYWIASSHNTYLTGNQLNSESSEESYIRCLRMGCRCVELDCCDGPDGIPVIHHKLTLTTTIQLSSVLQAIKEHAFVTSEYPVILSIENNCSQEQQKILAKTMVEILGDMLITEPMEVNENRLPSPEQLKKKILLKGKTSKFASKPNWENATHTPKEIKHKGIMYKKEGSYGWQERYFVLKKTVTDEYELFFTELPVTEDRESGATDIHFPFHGNYDDLHEYEKWFHGKISSAEVERRVMEVNVEGAFLVKESESCPGTFVICTLVQGKVHQLKVDPKFVDGKKQYVTRDEKCFESFFSLVVYYESHPIFNGDEVLLNHLTVPIDPPTHLEAVPWFYPNIDKCEAENLLREQQEGTFLVRHSQNARTSRFAISFRYGNIVKHCRVREQGRFFLVSARRFERVTDLVQYYTNHCFYEQMRLKTPVIPADASKDIQTPRFSVQGDDTYDYTSDYVVMNARAVRSYTPPIDAGDDYLTFDKGDLIANVRLQGEDGWSRGDLREAIQKLFPSDAVEMLCNTRTCRFGKLLQGSLPLGVVEIVPTPTSRRRTGAKFSHILKMCSEKNVVIAELGLKTLKEAKVWKKHIHFANNIPADHDRSPWTRFRWVHKAIFRPRTNSGVVEELSKLYVYLQAIPKFEPDFATYHTASCREITSRSDNNASRELRSKPSCYNNLFQKQLARIYPNGMRVDSKNFKPSMWNLGVQMVAFNYQTPDKWQQFNLGRFLQNNKCGYVLKPPCLLTPNLDPMRSDCDQRLKLKLQISVIAARNLIRCDKRAIIDPYVEIEIFGPDYDAITRRTERFSAGTNNYLSPCWRDEHFVFTILNPDLALIRFYVFDKDAFGDLIFIGQATFPIRGLRSGYRSIQLMNGFGETLLAVLLVRLRIQVFEHGEETEDVVLSPSI